MSVIPQCRTCGQPHPARAGDTGSFVCSCGALVETDASAPSATTVAPAPEPGSEAAPPAAPQDPLRKAIGEVSGWALFFVVPGILIALMTGCLLLIALSFGHLLEDFSEIVGVLVLVALVSGACVVTAVSAQLSNSAREYERHGRTEDLAKTGRDLKRFFRASGISLLTAVSLIILAFLGANC